MSIEEAYQIMAKASGIQVGDTVKVLRKAYDNEMGWSEVWTDSMDMLVGNSFIVKEVTKNGIYVVNRTWGLPFFVLEVLKKGQPAYDLKPFDKVLVRDNDIENWEIDLYSRTSTVGKFSFRGLRSWYTQCIPFNGHEHLLGTNNKP